MVSQLTVVREDTITRKKKCEHYVHIFELFEVKLRTLYRLYFIVLIMIEIKCL